MHHGRFATALFLLAATLTVAARQQPAGQKPTFRVAVNLVQVDVFVTDSKGHFVPDLTKDDFELLEDGKVQPLTTFSVVNLPVTDRALPEPAEPVVVAPRAEVATNEGFTQPRVYVLMLDDIQTPAADSTMIREAAVQFIDRYLGPSDVAAVLLGSGSGDISSAFTRDHARLRGAANSFLGSGLGGARLVTARMRQVSDYLAGLSGRRKACIYFGPGFSTARKPISMGAKGGTDDPSIGNKPYLGNLDEVDYRDLVASANRANVSYYTIQLARANPLANLVTADVRGEARGDEAGAKTTNAAAAKDALDVATDGRLSLAADTGGVGALNRNADDLFRRVQAESSSYYMLGYQTGATEKATLRKIVVRARRPGVTIRARRQFWWPGSSSPPAVTSAAINNAPPALASALQYPLLGSDIHFTAAVAPFKGASEDAWADVTIELDSRDLNATGRGALDFGVVSVNDRGEMKGSDARRLDLALDPEGLERMRANGLRVQTRLRVPAGAGTIRLAVIDPATSRLGSLWIDIDVPDYSKPALAMSGVVLTHKKAPLTPTANVDQELRALLPAPVTARRDFTPDDTLVWLAEIYPSSESVADLQAVTVISDASGTAAFTREQPLARDTSKVMRVTNTTDLARFAPGDYVLRIEVRTIDGSQSVRRETPFSITSAKEAENR